MMEVFPRPEHVVLWTKAAQGERMDWDKLFEGFNATVDWPSSHFWRELIQRYPNAKVIHTEREPELWYASFSQTIGEAMTLSDTPAEMLPWAEMTRLIITEQTFDGDYSKANVLKVYDAHNAEVKRSVPATKRLDFDIAQGWEPLCRFLGVAVPGTPFPKTNTTADFRARIAARRK